MVGGGGGDFGVARTGEQRRHIRDTLSCSQGARVESAPDPPVRQLNVIERRYKIERAQALLSHAVPDGDIAVVLDRALTLLIEDTEKRRFGSRTQRKRAKTRRRAPANADAAASDTRCQTRGTASESVESDISTAARSRYIPVSVRREVYTRDEGRCAWVAPDGRRCAETRWLELDHVEPWSRGGPSTAHNLRLACKSHNLHAARQAFGRDHVASCIRKRVGTTHSTEPEPCARSPHVS